jgi:hypothetical protein
MSIPLLWIVTVLYAITSGDLFVQKQYGSAIVFFGYALANVGLILAMSK